jgi:hypothetical protein
MWSVGWFLWVVDDEQLLMGGAYFTWDDECDWLDGGAADFVGSRDFAFGDVESAAREETHSPLGVGGLVL